MTPLEEKIVDMAAQNGSVLTWADFIGAALYDSQWGYYVRERERVGPGGDFFTSASMKCGVFGLAVAEAVGRLLEKEGEDPDEFEIVEIGAEPGYQMVRGARTIRLGQEIELSGNVSVVSNELLDARPFERFKYENRRWAKRAIEFGNSYEDRREILLDVSDAEREIIDCYFSRAQVEGFCLDISFDATSLFEKICLQNWRGALVFADYFRTADELSALPNGTARTYSRHRDGFDLFANVGGADITYSPCSDIFEDIARRCGRNPRTYTQESFFVHLAPRLLESLISSPSAGDIRKRELCQLISPAHMGACFRVLTLL